MLFILLADVETRRPLNLARIAFVQSTNDRSRLRTCHWCIFQRLICIARALYTSLRFESDHFQIYFYESTQNCHGRLERKQKSRQEGRAGRPEEEATCEKKRKLQHLHLQSSEASSSRHWYFQQSDEHHEFFRQRHLRTHRL